MLAQLAIGRVNVVPKTTVASSQLKANVSPSASTQPKKTVTPTLLATGVSHLVTAPVVSPTSLKHLAWLTATACGMPTRSSASRLVSNKRTTLTVAQIPPSATSILLTTSPKSVHWSPHLVSLPPLARTPSTIKLSTT
jgi:hypothetical protein